MFKKSQINVIPQTGFILPPTNNPRQSAGNNESIFHLLGFNHIVSKKFQIKYWIRIGILFSIWLTFTIVLMIQKETPVKFINVAVNSTKFKNFHIFGLPTKQRVQIFVNGPFLPAYKFNGTNDILVVELFCYTNTREKEISTKLEINLPPVDDLESTYPIQLRHMFEVNDRDWETIQNPNTTIGLRLSMASYPDVGLQIYYNLHVSSRAVTISLGALILIGMYVLIIWDIVHRTLAAIIASSFALAVLALCNYRPDFRTIIAAIDSETLLLLMSMMILVTISSHSGIFDYLAVLAYKKTKGKIWPLLNSLILITAVLSTILDNVTTVMLITPVIVRISEVCALDPVPVLTIIIMFCNIAGISTPVGDPPNLIISTSPEVIEDGVNFLVFILHMLLGAVLITALTYLQIRWMFNDINKLSTNKPREIQQIEHSIEMWKRAASGMLMYSMDEELMNDVVIKKQIQLDLKNEQNQTEMQQDDFEKTVQALENKYQIRDMNLVIKSGIAIGFVILGFFLSAIPGFYELSLAWTAFIGTILLIILTDKKDIHGVLSQVEWPTLIFFAALFVLMHCLDELGFIVWFGEMIAITVLQVSKEYRLVVAILLILWLSGLISAFVDNIPLTTVMVPVVIGISKHRMLLLPMQPLLWALALGGGLGGNGTLIAASCNIVCAGVAEQFGYKLTFYKFFKIGFPIMLTTLVWASLYLIVCHVAFSWH